MKKILNKYRDHLSYKEKAGSLKDEVVELLNPFIQSAYGRTISSGYDITVTKKKLDTNIPHFMAGLEVLEIWESDSEHDYARSYWLPVKFCKKGVKISTELRALEKKWTADWQLKARKVKEEAEKKEFIRLSKKFK